MAWQVTSLLCAFFIFMKFSIGIHTHTQTCIYVFVKITTEPKRYFLFIYKSVELYLLHYCAVFCCLLILVGISEHFKKIIMWFLYFYVLNSHL